MEELSSRDIHPTFWPAFSPDLNPIETVWNKMKDYIEQFYPEQEGERQLTYDQLRTVVQEVWESITVEVLRELIDSMPAHCQAVIEVEGGHTKY
ncbi:uncharacterized protein EI97DRAFT_380907 [Westerdykella ornata]|uniref:Tc1-like transposase DDE domain-containing protein n=1 Tax=Westerdykella ornata TaxID=318751 RepID=A0A6A6JEJ4_WESOR|nr:uncharacterized protein EI97DRAFT_380907 [Westerdykella ornata]KAF2274654.1 hypothetical protein EI97DRAFT_380907 [Westerdykella ornata]